MQHNYENCVPFYENSSTYTCQHIELTRGASCNCKVSTAAADDQFDIYSGVFANESFFSSPPPAGNHNCDFPVDGGSP